MSDEIEARLDDGSAPCTCARLLARLSELGIEHRTMEHPPIFTVEQARRLRGPVPGAHVKNLFLRNKRGHMWIVCCMAHRRLDLRALGDVIGSGPLSFGSPRRLMRYLGVGVGTVTPFAVINDKACRVRVVLDAAILEHDVMNAHPLVNDRTTTIASADLLRFLEAESHSPTVVDMTPFEDR